MQHFVAPVDIERRGGVKITPNDDHGSLFFSAPVALRFRVLQWTASHRGWRDWLLRVVKGRREHGLHDENTNTHHRNDLGNVLPGVVKRVLVADLTGGRNKPRIGAGPHQSLPNRRL